MNRIRQIFKNKSEKLIPFFTAGYPEKNDTIDMVLAADRAGASMIEIGIPFSDPIADGSIIQESSSIALENGVTMNWILEIVTEIRKKSEIPLALMGYINPIINFGLREFLKECCQVGVDGLIVPDMPYEEAGEYAELSKESHISPILLISPNSSPKRIENISNMAGDLVYCVSILGVTGSSNYDDQSLNKYLCRVKKYSTCPFIVGFGFKTRDDVRKINQIADGAVIGSAIINEMQKPGRPVNILKNYIRKMTA